LGLVNALEIEVERINNSGLINASVLIEGEAYSLGEQRELVLFRIFQEALNNTLKHSGAKHLKINLQYSKLLLNLTLEDDGVGFSSDLISWNLGSGLKNIQSRAALIGAVATIYSSPGKGCCIKVTLNPLEQQLYDNGAPTNRPG
jgi:signal transduction histidine kinase